MPESVNAGHFSVYGTLCKSRAGLEVIEMLCGEHIVAHKDPPLDLKSESGTSGPGIKRGQIFGIRIPVAVSDTVKAGKVGRGFGRRQDIVHFHRIRKDRHVEKLHLCSFFF